MCVSSYIIYIGGPGSFSLDFLKFYLDINDVCCISEMLQVHMCNKLASRHVRVGLASPSDVPRCDICENAPGTLCLSLCTLFLSKFYAYCH